MGRPKGRPFFVCRAQWRRTRSCNHPDPPGRLRNAKVGPNVRKKEEGAADTVGSAGRCRHSGLSSWLNAHSGSHETKNMTRVFCSTGVPGPRRNRLRRRARLRAQSVRQEFSQISAPEIAHPARHEGMGVDPSKATVPLRNLPEAVQDVLHGAYDLREPLIEPVLDMRFAAAACPPLPAESSGWFVHIFPRVERLPRVQGARISRIC